MIPPVEEIGGSQCPSVCGALEEACSSSVGGGPSGCPDVQLLLISKNVGGEEGGEEVGLVGEE